MHEEAVTVSVCGEDSTPPMLARICVEPTLRPVANPVVAMLATEPEDDDHVTGCPVTAPPLASNAWAANWTDRPTSMDGVAGETTTLDTVGTTTEVEDLPHAATRRRAAR
jgi:hypothetical protein